MTRAWIDEVADWASPGPAPANGTPGLIADVARIALITEARERGITWAAIGATMFDGASGKAAKAAAKRLARDANRELVAAEAQQPSGQPCRSRECDC